MLTLLISGVLYVLVGLSAVSVVAPDVLGGSARPLALVIQHDWGARGSDVIAAIALASTLNAALIVLTAASRLLYAMARAGRLPRQLTIVGMRGHAPYVAAVVALAAAMPFVLAGGLGLVASVADFAVYATFVAVNFSVIALRLQRPDVERPFRAPFSIRRVPVTPLLALATVIAMAAFLRPEAWMLGGGAIVLGAVAYWAFARGAAQET
jgi:APA family basic amino acid/polyamine antiporter